MIPAQMRNRLKTLKGSVERGRTVAQWQSICFTCRRSLVQSPKASPGRTGKYSCGEDNTEQERPMV